MSRKKNRRKTPKKQTGTRSSANKRGGFLRLATKIHAGFTVFSLLFYVAFGVLVGPEYLTKDISHKYKAIASETTLTLQMMDIPDKPVISASFFCNSLAPYVDITWTPSRFTDYYDIYRNDELLITGFSDTSYHDTNIESNTSYSYYVVANGPVGNIQSDVISLTTGSSCYVAPKIECTITAISGIDLSRYSGVPQIKDQSPTFSGTTVNVNFAEMEIYIDSVSLISGNTTANSNGYWSWTSPFNLSPGEHTVSVTARDPFDSSRFAETSRKFVILKEDLPGDNDEEEGSGHKKPAPSTPTSVSPGVKTPAIPKVEIPATQLKIVINVHNDDKTLYAGEELLTSIQILPYEKLAGIGQVPLTYQITDIKGNVIFEESDFYPLSRKDAIKKSILITGEVDPGNYIVRIIAHIDENGPLISSDEFFRIKERPVANIGLTSETSARILSYLGWIFLLLLLILLFFLILLFIEHRLSLKARFHISEDDLDKNGLIT